MPREEVVKWRLQEGKRDMCRLRVIGERMHGYYDS